MLEMGEVMQNPSVVEVEVGAAPDEVYEKIANPRTWRDWRKVDPKVKTDAKGELLSVNDVFKWVAGGVTITSTITEAEPGKVVAWKGKTLGGMLKAHHRWRFEEIGEGNTKVVCEEEMSGPLKFMMGKAALDKSNTEWLEELRASFDS